LLSQSIHKGLTLLYYPFPEHQSNNTPYNNAAAVIRKIPFSGHVLWRLNCAVAKLAKFIIDNETVKQETWLACKLLTVDKF